MSDFLKKTPGWAAKVAVKKRSIIVQASGTPDAQGREALRADLKKVFVKHGLAMKRFKVGPVKEPKK